MPKTYPPGVKAAELNEQILRSLIDYAIVTLDADGVVTSCNDGAELILGWPADEIIGQTADVFFTLEDVARNRPEVEMQTALEEGRADDIRWHRRKDGSHFWGSGLMMPLLGEALRKSQDAQNEPCGGFVKIFRDRTFQHEANARIAKLENRASLAMRRSGTVGVYDFDIDSKIIVADTVAAELHNVPAHSAEEGMPYAAIFDGIHAEDLPKVRRAFEESISDGLDFNQIYRSAQPDLSPRWIHSQATVGLNENNKPSRISGIVVDITDQHKRSRMQEMRLRFLDEVRDIQSGDDVAQLATRTIVETLYASRARYGYIASDGELIDVRADWNVDVGPRLIGRLHYSDFGSFSSILQDGAPVIVSDVREDTRVEDPAALEAIGIRSLVNLPLLVRGDLKAVLFVTDPRAREWSDSEVEFMRSIFERTHAAIEGFRYETERDIMTAELAHRMKNMLSIAQVVVNQTLRGSENIAEARTSIFSRLNALSDAQDVLTRGDHQAAPIKSVVEAALNAFSSLSDRVTMHGPNVKLTSQQSLGLSLALHELATNAVKHGAMSGEVGEVHIIWTNSDSGFDFIWEESGGPEVAAPAARGFGSTILDRVVGGYFNGKASVTFNTAGVRFHIVGSL